MTVMEATVNSAYKTRVFEMVFSSRTELLSLYNAVNGTNYTDPGQLTINTLKNAIYMSMHNDVSFVIDSRLSLYEHQSTYNPNLPLRYLFYVADLYSSMVKDTNLYGTKLIQIPTPKFIIFYNGKDKCPEQQELKLSASFNIQDEEPSLELRATLLNINPGYNNELKETCKTLNDYSEYTARIRLYSQSMPLANAVERAIDECIREDILSEFLTKNRAEAKKMSIYEYDEEIHMRQTREEGFNDGEISGSIKAYQTMGISQEATIKNLIQIYSLSPSEAQHMLQKYWN